MKKLLLIAIPALLLAACSKTPGPADTVREMYKKICEANSIKPMVDYAAPESAPLLGMAVQMAEDKDKGPKMKADLAQRCAKGIKVKEEKVEGDTAVVVLEDDEKPTTLRKIDGKWKITHHHSSALPRVTNADLEISAVRIRRSVVWVDLWRLTGLVYR